MLATVNGTRIFFDVDGKRVVWDEKEQCMKEKPVCFILHGGPGGEHGIYGTNFNWLKEYMQLVFIDFRGSGRSDRTDPSTYTIAQNVEDLEALRKYLGLDKIVLMGQSYGGIMSFAYGTAYPENVSSAILLCTSPSHNTFDEANKQLLERGVSQEMQEMFNQITNNGGFTSDEQFKNYLKLFAPLYSISEGGGEAYAKEMDYLIISHKPLNTFMTADSSFDFTPELHKMTFPTLLIGGEQDWICPIGETHIASAHLPNCQTVTLKDCSHELFIDQPEESRRVIGEFVCETIVPMTKYCR